MTAVADALLQIFPNLISDIPFGDSSKVQLHSFFFKRRFVPRRLIQRLYSLQGVTPHRFPLALVSSHHQTRYATTPSMVQRNIEGSVKLLTVFQSKFD